ncbi:unnamed protein product, partial [Symbiodinium microadriaticum]
LMKAAHQLGNRLLDILEPKPHIGSLPWWRTSLCCHVALSVIVSPPWRTLRHPGGRPAGAFQPEHLRRSPQRSHEQRFDSFYITRGARCAFAFVGGFRDSPAALHWRIAPSILVLRISFSSAADVQASSTSMVFSDAGGSELTSAWLALEELAMVRQEAGEAWRNHVPPRAVTR